MSDTWIETIQRKVRCGACGGKINRVNLVEINYKATWPYPTAGNLFNGAHDRAVAFVCEGCAYEHEPIREVVEMASKDAEPIYHPLTELERIEVTE
jgi:hypothetical protein